MRLPVSLVAIPLALIQVACTASPDRLDTQRSALIVSETPLCRVTLSKVSYDDPSTDDAEFMELSVERLGGGIANTDAGHSTGCGTGGAPSVVDAAGSTTSAALTLEQCGLSTIELLNGGSDPCSTYRTLAVGATVVPADDVVVVCSPDSVLATTTTCDVTMAGSSKLANGWLQNGPNDGFRFASGAAVSAEVSYDGVNSTCFQGAPASLVPETGQAADGGDDVNVACGAEFKLVSSTTLTPRKAPNCPSAADASTISSGGATSAGQGGTSSTQAVSTAAGATFGTTSQVLDQTQTGSLLEAGTAGASAQPMLPSKPSEPSACSVVNAGRGAGGAGGCATGLLVAIRILRRRARRHA